MSGDRRRWIVAAVCGVGLVACGAESASESTIEPQGAVESVADNAEPPTTPVNSVSPTTAIATTEPAKATVAATAAPVTTTATPATPPPAEPSPDGPKASPASSDCTSDPYVVMSLFAPYYDEAAVVVQRRLVELGFDVGKVDGYFGSDSASALDAWGASVGFEGTPYNVDNNSIEGHVLERLGVACPAPKSGCVLDIDPEGPAEFSETARRVQQRLAELGYSPGDIDGFIGPNSEQAIVRWSDDGKKRTYYWGEGSAGFSISEKGFDELGITCQ